MLAPASVFRFFALFGILFSLTAVSRAQDPTATPTPPPQQMALASPFALTAKPLSIIAKPSKWIPIAATLSNTGDPVSGTLRVKLFGDGQFDNEPNESYCPVDLPSNSNKVVWMYARFDRPNIRGIRVSFSGRGFPAMNQQIQVEEPSDGQRLVITISDETDSTLPNTLKALRGKGLGLPSSNPNNPYQGYNGGVTPNPNFNPTGVQGPVRPLLVSRENIPDRWFGLEGADLVVLGNFPHATLLPAQITALRGYVTGGGNLVAMGGANSARLSSSPLADLWPTQVSTSTTATGSEVGSIVQNYVANPKNGADRLGGAPVLLSRGALKPNAQVKQGTRNNPLVSTLDVGAGRTIMLGFDPSQPPFVGWSGQVDLWREVFQTQLKAQRFAVVDDDNVSYGQMPTGYSPYYQSGNNYARQPTTSTGLLLSALAKLPQLSMPPVSSIAWFLSLYVFVLVPLNYAVLRFLDRRELAWITIPVIVAIFSGIAYFQALSIRGNAIITRQVDVVQSSLGSKEGRADSLLWLFSPRRTSYDITSDRSDAAIADYANNAGGQQGAFSILQPADTSSFKVEGANVWMWTDRGFVSESLADLEKGITLKGDKIVNGTPFELMGAVWVQNRAVSSIGTIATGGSAAIPTNITSRANSGDLASAIASASRLDQIFPARTITNGVPGNALTVALGNRSGNSSSDTMLIAWVKKSMVPLGIGVSGANTNDFSLLIVRIPDSALVGLQRVASNEVKAKLISSESTNPLYPANFVSLATFECAVPASAKLNWNVVVRGQGGSMLETPHFASGMRVTQAVVEDVHRLTFQAMNPQTKKWVNVAGQTRRDASRDSAKAEAWEHSLDIPADFVKGAAGKLKLRIRRTSPETAITNVVVETRTV